MASSQNFSLKAVLSCVDNLSPTFKKVERNLKKVDRAFGNVVDSVANVAGKLAAPLAALAGAGAFSLQDAVGNFMRLGDSIDKAATRAGIATRALQMLRGAAELGGASADDMDDALTELGLKMKEALIGENENALKIFNQLGIKLKDTSGKARNVAEVMRDLAEGIRVNSDATDRLRIVDVLLGGDVGKRLIPVLSQGAKGLDEMTAEAQRLGIVMEASDVQSAVKLTDSMTIFGRVVDSVTTSIGARLSPILLRVIEQVQSALVANKALIATRIEEFVKELALAVEQVDFKAIINGVFDFVRGVSNAIDAIGGFKTIVYGIAAIMGASFISNIATVTTAVWGLSTAVYALIGPWGLVAAAVAAAIGAIVLNFNEIDAWFAEKGAAMGDWLSSAFETAAAKVMGAWASVKDFFSELFDWVGEKVSPILNVFGKLFDVPVVPTAGMATAAPIGSGPLIDRSGRPFDGTVTVRVEAAEGSRARVEDMRATGGSLEASTSGRFSYLDD